MANHNLPQTTSTYANFVAELDSRLDDLAMWLDPAVTIVTNQPVNTVRWSRVSNRWERFSGTEWSALSASYSININGSIGAISPNTGTFTTISVLNSAALPADTTVSGNQVVSVSSSQSLTNKTLVTPVIAPVSSGISAGAFGYLGGALLYGDGSIQQELVSLSRNQTLTNKTLVTPNIGTIRDIAGNTAIVFNAVGGANQVTLSNAAASGTPVLAATGSDASVSLNIVPKGAGTVQVGGDQVATLVAAQTLSNKLLANPTLSNSASGILTGRLGYSSGVMSYGDGATQRTLVSTDLAQTITNKIIGTGSTWAGSTLPVSVGGTGTSEPVTPGGVVYGLNASTYSYTAAGSSGALLRSNGAGTPPTWEEFSLSVHAQASPYKEAVSAATTTDLVASTFIGNTLSGYSSTHLVSVTTSSASVSASATSTAGFRVGSTISGNSNIPAEATVASITSATAFTLSIPATITGTVVTTFTNSGIAPLVVDGVPMNLNDRLLVKDTNSLGSLNSDTTLARLNGIYTVTFAGNTTAAWTLTRSADADTVTKLDAVLVPVLRGVENGGQIFQTTLSSNSILNTTPIYWYLNSAKLASSLGPTPVNGRGFDIDSKSRLQRLIGGSLTDLAVNSFGIVTLQTTAASTYSRASTVFIAGAPISSTGTTTHSPFALYIASGAFRTEGALTVGQSLSVLGNSTLSGALSAEGPATLSSTLAVTGNSTFTGPIAFSPILGQRLNLWSSEQFGLGVQTNTLYHRSSSRFSWFRGGVHADTENNAGGGIVAMSLDGSSNLTVAGAFFGAGTGLTGTAAGLSIGGNAATVTDGVTLSGAQTITGQKTFTQAILASDVRWGVAGSRGIALASATNLDTVVNAGFYDVGSATNVPTGSGQWLHLVVSRGHNERWVTQTVTDFDSDRVWVRRSIDSGGVAAWQPWVEVLHVNNGSTLSTAQTITGQKTFTQPIIGSTNTQVSLTGVQTIGGQKTFTEPIIGTMVGSVGASGDQVIGGVKTFSSPIIGSTTTQVSLTGDQTVTGAKTFSSPIIGSTNSQVSLTGDQSVAGIKTFTGDLRWGAEGSRGIILPNNTNLDTVLNAGFYDCNTTVNAPGTTHGWLHLVVTRGHSSAWVQQIATDLHSNRMWFRRNAGNAWQPWNEMFHTGNRSSVGGRQVFTSSGSFTVPIGVTTLYITACGGGGGGGGASHSHFVQTGETTGYEQQITGGPGGGGASTGVVRASFSVSPSSVLAVTIGGGGSGGHGATWPGAGGAGGTTSLSSIVSFAGGGGGAPGNPSNPMQPGAGGAWPQPALGSFSVLNAGSVFTHRGAGGSGGQTTHEAGTAGNPGIMIIEW